ncbi:hypothetical protein C8Q80DRAFT_1275146 [Daedaleopsis nitida]|nr:hypothetical protein C8Q80DRAFT_1275146 [Daedaleopsis nitida]
MSDYHSQWSTIDPLLLAIRDHNDRVEVPPASSRAHEAVISLEPERSSEIDLFEQDMDDILALSTLQDAQMGPDAIDLDAMFDLPAQHLLFTSQTAPVFSDGPADTANSPPSPVSDYTLVASPSPSRSLDKFLFDGDEIDGHVIAPTDAFGDYEFTFMFMHPAVSVTSITPPVPVFSVVSINHGYGQPGSQQKGVAANTDAYGPVDGGVRENENMFSFSSTTPADLEPSPSPSAQEPIAGMEHTEEEEPPKKRKRNPSGAPIAKRRRPQSTARNFVCPYERCKFASARNNNLQTHIKSKHEGKRPFVCKQAGCGQAFARKHDADRHFQSKHTDNGSPRRESKLRRAMKAEQ